MKKLHSILLASALFGATAIFSSSCKDNDDDPQPTTDIADGVVGRYTLTDSTFALSNSQFVEARTVSAEITKVDASRVKLTGFVYQTCDGDTARADVTSSALILVASSCTSAQNFTATRDGNTIRYSFQSSIVPERHQGKAVKQ